MSEESGFEVAKAWVSVSPDASDFAAALDEQIGGISISVLVTPDASDFAAALDEQIGGLSATVAVTPDIADFAAAVDEEIGGMLTTASVMPDMTNFADAVSEQAGGAISTRVVPDTADFGTALDEQVGGTEVPVAVVPDTSDFEAALGEDLNGITATVNVQPDTAALVARLEEIGTTAGLGGLPVRVTPDVSDFADALGEETSGLAVSATVVPDVSGLQDQVDEQAGDLTATVTVDADTTQAVTAIQELEAEAADDSEIQTLYNGILSIGPAATQAEMEAVDALGGIREAAASVSVGDAAAQIGEIGTAAQSAASEVTSSLGEADSGIETFLGGIYRLGPAATEEGAQIADAMGNAWQGVADLASAAGSVDYSAATAGLSSVDDAAASLAGDAPAAAEASKGLSGVLGTLGERLSYVAVDPFMWMYAAPMVISGVAAAVKALSDSSGNLVTEMAQQDQASGYNISGYQKVAAQLGNLVPAYQKAQEAASNATQNFVGGQHVTQMYGQTIDELSQGSQHYSQVAVNLTGNLGTLEQQYGLTATQAEELASAAGVSYKQLEGSGTAAQDAMGKIEAYANANLDAAGPVNQLANDSMLFGDSALSASTRISALSDSFSRLVGNQVAVQQSMLGVQNDLQAVQADATVAGASMTGTGAASESLQAAFYATIPAIEQTAQSMINAKDSSAQVTSYVQEQIDALSGLTGGSATASAAVQGLRQWEENLGLSVDTTSTSILQSARNLQDSFIKQLEDAGAKSSTTKTDVDELTNSILATGDKSTSTEAARAQLIKDLENAGLTAQKAAQLVDQFTRSIQNIPSSKTVSIVETATGTITINEAQGTATTQGAGGNTQIHSAEGGLITGGSRRPKANDIHAMLSHREYVVRSDAVDHYGVGMLDSINAMHFAEGGYAGGLEGLGAWTGMQYAGLTSNFTAQMEALLAAAIGAKAPPGSSASGPVIVNVNFNGTQVPGPEQMHAITSQLSAAIGVS